MIGEAPALANRVLAAAGALGCAVGVALGAYAAHAAEVAQRERLAGAALYALLHGIALAALAPPARGLRRWALLGLLLGVGLFSGSLAAAALFGGSTALAPIGGGLLIVSWLLLAISYVWPGQSDR